MTDLFELGVEEVEGCVKWNQRSVKLVHFSIKACLCQVQGVPVEA